MSEVAQDADPSQAMNDGNVMTSLGDGEVLHLDAEAGRAKLRFHCRPAFCHSGGVAQGGFVTGWADSAMAHAAMARYGDGVWVATLELKVSFYRPTPPGVVIAEGWIERAGRQTAFLEGRVTDDAGEVMAKASCTVRLVPDRS